MHGISLLQDLASAHGEHRNALTPTVSRNPLRFRVKDGLTIHKEQVLMVPMAQRDRSAPGPIIRSLHGVGTGCPTIEVPQDANGLGFGSLVVEVDRLLDMFDRIAVLGATNLGA